MRGRDLMAQTWDSKRVQHERAMNERLRDDMLDLAARVSQLVLRYASERDKDGNPIIPNRQTTRTRLKVEVWSTIVKPYFIGQGDEPLIGQIPQSPFMTLIRDGVVGAVQIQVDRQVSIIKKYGDPDIVQFLTGYRPTYLDVQEMRVAEIGRTQVPVYYDPWHLFVDPNGYTLSDKGWQTGLQARRAIDALLNQHIGLGTSAVDLAKLLEAYLWPAASNITTKTPYGTVGSYWARRLARTEITAAAGRAVVNSSIANPFVTAIDWRLSGSHKDYDICDENAANGPYPPENVPPYPAHPHDTCSLIPKTDIDSKALNAQLRREIQAAKREYMRGMFQPDWLLAALLGGYLLKTLFRGREDQEAA